MVNFMYILIKNGKIHCVEFSQKIEVEQLVSNSFYEASITLIPEPKILWKKIFKEQCPS